MVEPMDLGGAGGQNDRAPLINAENEEHLLGNEYYAYNIPGMICATNQRHCAAGVTTLAFRKKVKHNLFSIKTEWDIFEGNSNKLIFQCNQKSGFLIKRMTLTEIATGLPALNFNTKDYNLNKKFNMRQGSSKSKGDRVGVCRLTQSLFITKLTMNFEDILSGANRHVVIIGDHWVKDFKVYLWEPTQGCSLIALIRDPPSSNDNYHVNIGPGVDMAMIIGLLLIVDDNSNF